MTKRAGFTAIIGAPNAGKSTFLNQAVGEKISIVTPKAQTTRFRIRGVCIRGQAQIVFVDTPGVFSGKGSLDAYMLSEAWNGASEADALLYIVDAKRGLDEENESILKTLRRYKEKPIASVINKVDLIDKPKLFALATMLNNTGLFQQIFMTSALKADGVNDVLDWVSKQLPVGEWLYPEDQLTDLPQRMHAAEVTREQLFMLLQKELPYRLMVETESWEEREGGGVFIAQAIVVERESHKKIIIGKGGAMLKQIGSRARKILESELEQKVFLKLFVKVEPDWQERIAKQGIYG